MAHAAAGYPRRIVQPQTSQLRRGELLESGVGDLRAADVPIRHTGNEIDLTQNGIRQQGAFDSNRLQFVKAAKLAQEAVGNPGVSECEREKLGAAPEVRHARIG